MRSLSELRRAALALALIPLACARPPAHTEEPPPARPATARPASSVPARAVPSASAAAPLRSPSSAVPPLPPGCHAPGPIACNPLTNAGCGGGAACDDDDHGGFKCYPPPNEVKEGGDCNIVEGPSCAPGLGCNGVSERDPDGECARFCCADRDCHRGERCVPVEPAAGALGFCE